MATNGDLAESVRRCAGDVSGSVSRTLTTEQNAAAFDRRSWELMNNGRDMCT